MTMWQNSKAIILSSMVAGAAMLSSCATINSDGDYNRIISKYTRKMKRAIFIRDRKLLNLVVFVTIMIMATSCQTAPKVIADLEGNYPTRTADSVMVYEVGKAVPPEAKIIGKVRVVDGGITPTYKCLYCNMLALAVKKTAESGGNVLRIDEHKTPSFWTSTCHRIWGTMMLMPDSLVDSSTISALQEIELNKDKELADMTRKQIGEMEKLFNNPSNIIRINAGCSWITSEIYTPVHRYKSKTGFTASVDYQHFWKSGFGLAANYVYFKTSFDEGINATCHYIGPSVIYGLNLGRKWRFDCALGLGYASWTESISGYYSGVYYDLSETQSCLGVLSQLGIEYKISNQIGIGIQLNGLSMNFDKPEGYNQNNNYGIRRLDTTVGLRYYF